MTDKEIELLFKSINDFDAFHQEIKQRHNLTLENDVEIKFDDSLAGHVHLHLPDRVVTLDNLAFEDIINDLSAERVNQDDAKR